MPVVRCPGCDRQLNVPDTAQRVKCPQCSQVFATNSDGISAGAPAASTAVSSAAALVTAAPPSRPKPAGREPAERESAERPADRGNEILVVIVLAVVAALILFAVVGVVGMWFFLSTGDDFMIDHEPPEPQIMIEEAFPEPQLDPGIDVEKPVRPVP